MKTIVGYFNKHFPQDVKTIGDIDWKHAVNSRNELASAINNRKAMLLECDVRISGRGEIILAHPPAIESDILFAEAVAAMKDTPQGFKFDFKDPEILIECFRILAASVPAQPYFVNADILPGNGMPGAKFAPEAFFYLCRHYCPDGIVSPGWVTTPDLPYTKENVDRMLRLCQKIDNVTFPVRACLLEKSWAELKRLLENPGHTLTIWNGEPLTLRQRKFIKEHTDPSRCFYDLVPKEVTTVKIRS